jgi:hypothetical protein
VQLQPHGQFEILWHPPVLLVRYEGAWNEQAALALHAQARLIWQEPIDGAWAMLTDATQWEGATPEAFARWWEFFADAVQHGMVAVTDVLPSHFHEVLVKDLAVRASQLARHRTSADLTEAWDWLATQGFTPDLEAEPQRRLTLPARPALDHS